MVSILSNVQPGGPITVRIYNQNERTKDIMIGTKNDDFETLKEELIKILEKNGSNYKKKYERMLKKAIGRLR